MYLKCVHGNEGPCYECSDIKQFNKCVHGKLLSGQYCLECNFQKEGFPQEAQIQILNAKVEVNETITIKKELWDEMLAYKKVIQELLEFKDNTECEIFSMDKKLDNIFEVMNLLDFDKRFKELERKVNLINSNTEKKCAACFKPLGKVPYYEITNPRYLYCSFECLQGKPISPNFIANCL